MPNYLHRNRPTRLRIVTGTGKASAKLYVTQARKDAPPHVVEEIGTVTSASSSATEIDKAKISKWLNKGAEPSPQVVELLTASGLMVKHFVRRRPAKGRMKKYSLNAIGMYSRLDTAKTARKTVRLRNEALDATAAVADKLLAYREELATAVAEGDRILAKLEG